MNTIPDDTLVTVRRIYLKGERCGQVRDEMYEARGISAQECERAWWEALGYGRHGRIAAKRGVTA